jgi:hypothetical protein
MVLITTYIGLVGFFAGIKLFRVNRGLHSRDSQAEGNAKLGNATWGRIVFLSASLLFVVAVLISVGRSYSTWDAIAIWSAKGYGIALEDTVFAGEIWGAHHLNYPLNIPILISLFRSLEGDLLPGSKLIFPLFYISLLLGCYSFWRTSELKRGFAAIGLLFVATIPIVFTHATIGYANLPFSVYLVLGIIIGIEGILNRSKNLQLLSGILLALAAWTRPEGLFITPITIFALMLAFRSIGRGEMSFGRLILPAIIIVIPWGLFSGLYGTGGMFQSAAGSLLQSFGAGVFHLDSLYWIVRSLGRQLLEIKIWGLVIPVAVLVVITQRSKFQPRKFPLPFMVLMLTMVIGLSVTAFYYLVSFEGDLRFWLETGVNRMYLPAGLLGAVWVILYAGIPGDAERVEEVKSDGIMPVSG